jgi:hypothetical protein
MWRGYYKKLNYFFTFKNLLFLVKILPSLLTLCINSKPKLFFIPLFFPLNQNFTFKELQFSSACAKCEFPNPFVRRNTPHQSESLPDNLFLLLLYLSK